MAIGDHSGQLNESLAEHEIDVKWWGHGVTAVSDAGNLPSSLAQARIVDRNDERCVFRKHAQRAAHHRPEQVVRVPGTARKHAIVRRPVKGMPAGGADDSGNGVPPETGELSKSESSRAFPRSMLWERVDALVPEVVDLVDERQRLRFFFCDSASTFPVRRRIRVS